MAHQLLHRKNELREDCVMHAKRSIDSKRQMVKVVASRMPTWKDDDDRSMPRGLRCCARER